MDRLRVTGLFVYFRLLANPVLRDPIGLAGLVALIADPGWSTVALCLSALVVSFGVYNGRLFDRAARDKRALRALLARYDGAVYRHLSPARLRQHFDCDFLIPSLYRPEWMQSYFARHRWHVLIVKRGTSRKPPMLPTAHVSPIGLDSYVFLRDNLDNIGQEQQFFLAHELGHAAGMFGTNSQRNEIGLRPVFLSLGWTILHAPMSSWLVAFTVVQGTAALLIDATLFRWYRARERFFAEIIADYVGIRHLGASEAAAMLRTGMAERLMAGDRTLTNAQNGMRRHLFLALMRRQAAGEAIDVPQVYLDYTFRHPWFLKLFVGAHFAYLLYFANGAAPALLASGLLSCIAVAYYLLMAWRDAAARVAIDKVIGTATAG